MPQTPVVQEQNSSLPRPWWLLAIALTVAAGCLLRFLLLGTQSLWFDEGYSAWVITLEPGRIIDVIRHDVSPPLYYLLLRQWAGVFGDSETALRSFSAVSSCLTIPLAGAIAWHMTRSGAGALVATAVMSVSVLQIQYAQEARSYALASLLASVALYAAVRRMSGTGAWFWLMFAMLACCVYLHNMMWFYVAGLGLAYLVMPGQLAWRRRVAEVAGLALGVVLVYACWIPSLLGQVRWLQGNFWASTPSTNDLSQVLVAVSGMKLMHLSALMSGSAAGWSALLLLFAIAAFALVGRSATSIRWAIAVLLFGVAPVLAVYAYAQVSQSYFVEKVFTASSIAIALLAALLLRSRLSWTALVLIPALILGSCVSVWGYLRWEHKEDWRAGMQYVNSLPRDDTLVVFVANEGELLYEYYLRQQGGFAHDVTGVPQSFHDLHPQKTIQRVRGESDTLKLRQKLREHPPQRLVLVQSHTHFSDPSLLTRRAIEQQMKLTRENNFHLLDVLEFER